MKKLIAIFLAVAMLCSLGFADTYVDTTNVYWDDDVWAWKDSGDDVTELIGHLYPGDDVTLELNYELFDWLNGYDSATDPGDDAEMDTDHYTVTTNFADGSEWIASKGFVDGSYIYTIKQDYTQLESDECTLQFERIYIKLKGSLNDHLELLVDKFYFAVNDGVADLTELSTTKSDFNDADEIGYVYLLYVDSYYTGGKELAEADWPEYLQAYRGLAHFNIGYPAAWGFSASDDLNVDANMPVTAGSNDLSGATPYGDPDCYNYNDYETSGVDWLLDSSDIADLPDYVDQDADDPDTYDNIDYSEAENQAGGSDDYQRSYIVGLWNTDGVRKDSFTYYGYDADYEVALDFTLKNKEYVWLEVNDDEDDDIEDIADEADADIVYINFTGNPKFTYDVTISIFADEDEFVYAYADGKILDSGLSFDEDKGYWVGTVKELLDYVVSDVELSVDSASDSSSTSDDNPDTGANDAVGIASALAVVALISAAAVSFKK